MKYKKKVDKNQNKIVKGLRKLGYSVELDKDDIIVGKHGITKWIEIKDGSPFNKNGKLTKGFIKDSQYKILWNWQGQYNICWRLKQILGMYQSKNIVGKYSLGIKPLIFRECYKEWLTESELNRLRREEIIQDGIDPYCPFDKFIEGLE